MSGGLDARVPLLFPTSYLLLPFPPELGGREARQSEAGGRVAKGAIRKQLQHSSFGIPTLPRCPGANPFLEFFAHPLERSLHFRAGNKGVAVDDGDAGTQINRAGVAGD